MGSYPSLLPCLLHIPILPRPHLTGACALPPARAVFSPAHAPGGRVVDYQLSPGSLEMKNHEDTSILIQPLCTYSIYIYSAGSPNHF